MKLDAERWYAIGMQLRLNRVLRPTRRHVQIDATKNGYFVMLYDGELPYETWVYEEKDRKTLEARILARALA